MTREQHITLVSLQSADALMLLQTGNLPLSQWPGLADDAFEIVLFEIDKNGLGPLDAEAIDLVAATFYGRLSAIAMTPTSGVAQ